MTAPAPVLHATVVALFPEIVATAAETSILGRASRAGTLLVTPLQLRDYATDKHRNVDDTPCGGGPGLVLKVDVVVAALRDAIRRDEERFGPGRTTRVVLLDAGGRPFRQADARGLAQVDHLVLLCGRYEGFDARVHAYVDERISIGDYVLTGGELAAAVVLDATAREVSGVLGNEASRAEESHAAARLEYRQYTRPIAFEDVHVPPVLLSGDHRAIALARQRDALHSTLAIRPDLIESRPLDDQERRVLAAGSIASLSPAPEGPHATRAPDAAEESP